MGHLRSLLVIASVSLAGTACSGSSFVDIDAPGSAGSSSGSGTGVGGDAGAGSSSEGSTPSPSVPTADASTGDDADNPFDAAALDATLDAATDASPPDGGSAGDATPPDDGSAVSPPDGGATFACGPSLRCDPAREYCYVAPSSVGPVGPVEDIVFPLDASSRYSCIALPACDASDACICIQGGGGVLTPVSTLSTNIVPTGPTCSCNDSKGDITRTCTNSGVVTL